MSRTGKSIEIESRLVVGGGGRGEGLTTHGHRVYLRETQMF